MVTLTSLGLSGSVLAHHGVTGRYDASRPIVLSGTVTEAAFTPPHPILSVHVDTAELPDFEVGRAGEYFGRPLARPEDVGQVRQIEFSPARAFYALGDRLNVGDRVVIVATRNCLPPHQLRSSWIRLSGGETLSYTGDWAPGVNGCS
ncbi:DUF6152 family protein [Neorhizobium sp. DT-125]|uniref:DUF6152 family protein n=1 Tax=Neorhizobium sp. DT-125 TaxID=3396163 RepID=UPI003F1D4E6A